MNIYEDYKNYSLDNAELINKLKSSNSKIMIMIEDVIKLLDYLALKVSDGANLSKEEDEIFDIGYGYYSNTIHSLSTYYNDYFNKDLFIFEYYVEIMIDIIYIDDILGYLDSIESKNTSSIIKLNNLSKELDDVMLKKSKLDKAYLTKIGYIIEECLPTKNDYQPAHIIFQMMCEELHL